MSRILLWLFIGPFLMLQFNANAHITTVTLNSEQYVWEQAIPVL